MTHHVTCHVTVSHATSLSKRKIKEKKNKIVSVQASYNTNKSKIEELCYKRLSLLEVFPLW